MIAETTEDTLQRILSSYDLGRKLRALRLRKKIALVDLGKHTGLSASMLSQLENGKLVPTLPTLVRIAMVFDVGLEYFFNTAGRRAHFSIVRAAERIKFPDRTDSANPNYYFECLAFSAQQKSLQAYMAEFPRRAAEDVIEHVHDGAEFVHVMEGNLAIRFHEEEFVLKPGDSAYFDSSEPHGYRGVGKGTVRAMVVTTPPRL